MSKVAIKGNASGTGTFTLEAPDSNDDRTLVLPDEAGTVVTSASADFAVDVTTTANVGAGTASPAAKLDVHNSSFGGSATTLHLSSTNSASEVIPYAGLGYVVDQGADGSEAGSLTLSTYSSSALTERARFNSGTGLLIGTTNNSPAESSSVTGIRLGYSGGTQFSKAGSEVMRVNRNTNDGRLIGLCGQATVRGEIAVSGTTIQYTSFSDHRLKENVTAISDGIGLVKTLNPVNFDWIETSQNVNGFLAHEVQTVVPEAVTGTHNEVDDEGNPVYQGIDQSKLAPILTAALQEAIAKIETLEAKVAALEATP